LLELGRLDAAHTELATVLRAAPENLAAIRGLAEVYRRRGSIDEALAQYRAALQLAPNDPDLDRTVSELARAVRPSAPGDSATSRATRVVAALEQWLSAIHVARAQRRA